MKKVSKYLSIIIIGCLSILFNSCNSSKDMPIAIGVLTPLTGDGANYGRSTKEGIDLAVEEINSENYLDKPLKIIYEDDKISPTDGVSAINKIISVDKVPLIIGPFGSSVTLAVAPIANKNKVIIIGASATADNIKDAGDYVFRITPPNSKQGRDVATFCIDKLKTKRAAIIYQNNDYGVTLKSAFENNFKHLGGEITISEGVDLGIKDLKTQILKIKGGHPDVVFFPLHIAESGILLKQSKELGLNAKFISCDGAMVDDLLNVAGDAAEGTYYTSLALGYGVSDSLINKFIESFKMKYKKEPDVYAAYYYEVTKIVAYSIKNAGYKADSIKKFLYSIQGMLSYKGITGITTFDSNGEVDKSFSIYVVDNRKFELFK